MKEVLINIFEWLKNLFSKSDEASILRLGFVWVLLLITHLIIFYLIFSAQATLWHIDIVVIKDISTTIIALTSIIFTGKIVQKVVEVKKENNGTN